MADKEELLINRLFDHHFYQLAAYIKQLRANYPRQVTFIEERLVQYAANINSLSSGVSPISAYHSLPANHGQQFVPANFTTDVDIVDIPFQDSSHQYTTTCDAVTSQNSLDSQPVTCWSPTVNLGSALINPSQNWLNINGQLSNHTEPDNDMVNADHYAISTIVRPLSIHPSSDDERASAFQPLSWQESDANQVQNRYRRITSRLLDSSPGSTELFERVECGTQHYTSSQTCVGAYSREPWQVTTSTNNSDWNNSSTELYDPESCPVPGMSFVVCSVEFLESLKSLLRVLRTSHGFETYHDANNIAHISQAIDNLEGVQQLYIIRRRILLYQFAAYRQRTVQQVSDSRVSGQGGALPAGSGSIETEVLDRLVAEIHPDVVKPQPGEKISFWRQRYSAERKKIQNRSSAARNWWRAVAHYRLGILVVLPSDVTGKWQSYQFETLKNREREEVFKAWDDANGKALAVAASSLTCIVQGLLSGTYGATTLSLELEHIPQEIDATLIEQLLEPSQLCA